MSDWTKVQLDFREMVARTVNRYGSARATTWGIDKIFPPIERPSLQQVRTAINRELLGTMAPADRIQDPRTTWELLRECLLEADIEVMMELGTAPPYTRDMLRFTARSRPAAASE